MRPSPLLCLPLVALTLGCRPQPEAGPAATPAAAATVTTAAAPELAIAPDVGARLARFAKTELAADLAALAPADREVLARLVAAARFMDEIFLRQAWEGNPGLRAALAGATGENVPQAVEYFVVNRGPWDRLDEMAPFIGDRPHPPGAGFYPDDATKEELETWLAAHPGERDRLLGLTTVVRRDPTAGFVAVPYSQAYREWLEPAAQRLREAAAAATNARLKRFLELRADAFLSDDYYASDVAWMDVDAPVEVTIGPYETYEDGLYGAKAAFEAFVTVALPEESAALARYKQRLPWLERNLPLPDEHKNFQRGTESPIRVVDVVFTAGDANQGVQTIAFNLPNDERVREAKGSKKVLLRNVMRAKYDQILLPIADRVLAPADRARDSFDAFFDEVQHHELSHGLGPGTITVGGRQTEVRQELKELYATLEEAKADVAGVYDILALIERGEMPAALRQALEPTYVAGLFRSARFGLHEAHGKGVVAQFSYLLRQGALQVDGEGRFAAVSDKFPAAIRALLAEMLLLQARGDYEGTRRFLDEYGQPGPELEAAVARLGEVPVDITPVYRQAAELAP